ncbi:MAG: TetR/AcrR family transcriptional regulator [Candidatus Binatia bacterium]
MTGSTRDTILAAAEAILSRGGEKALSIRELCARVGVTAPTIYHHFGDKDGLVAEVVDLCFTEFDRAIAEGPTPADPVEALAWAFDRYVAYGVAHPAHYRLLFQRKLERPTPSGIAAYTRLERLAQAIDAAGRLRVPVSEAAPAFWAAVHGVTTLVIAGFMHRAAPAIHHVRDALSAHLTTLEAVPTQARRGGSR